MELLFCKNTGGYLAQTADFCSHCDSPSLPFKIVPPSAPMDIDTFSWVKECPQDTAIRLHPNTQLRRNVRSILNRKQISVSLLINRDSGCFVEFDNIPEEMEKNFIPFQTLLRFGSLVICLIRHRLLESDKPASLYSDKNTNVFQTEEGCEFLKRNGHSIIRNRYSGRAFRVDPGNFDFIWIDAGSLVDDVQFIGKLWGLLAEGGLLCLHEPYFTATIKDNRGEQLAMVRTPLWEYIVKSNVGGIDILSLPEHYKYRQSGLGILRKRLGWEANRGTPFQEEMLAVNQAPIRFSVLFLFHARFRATQKKIS